ncbi:helix-turn-helix domain-containing protein [Streptomyces yerevanensis]|uniref:helix-turn-helix domain-containing protein n=1 Tax=Streptomyces yerevanensis TaxID=66378 RepID=UPI00099701ED
MQVSLSKNLPLKQNQLAQSTFPMTDQRKTSRSAVEAGPTSAAVACNVRRVRERRGYSTYQMSRLLKEGGRPISPAAISKLERGERRVDVDDLTALASVLGISPAALLLPLTDSDKELVEVTGASAILATVAWDWALGRRPLRVTPGKEQTELLEYQLYSLPPWLRGPVGPRDALRDRSPLRDPRVGELLEEIAALATPRPLPEHHRKQGGTDGQGMD